MRAAFSFLFGAGFAVVIAVVVLSVEFGGISYRKDCATGSGAISRSWSFQWFAPIPFVFRPSENGCNVHVGTRVLLSDIGIDRIKPETAGGIATQAATETGSPIEVYYSQVYADLTAWAALMKADRSNAVLGFADTRALTKKLGAIGVPAGFQVANRRVISDVNLLEQDLSAAASGNGTAALSAAYTRHLSAASDALDALQRQVVAAIKK